MFPTTGDLHIAPFTDDALHMEQFSKANFWYQQSFHGVDLTSLRRAAIEEYFKQPIVVSLTIEIWISITLYIKLRSLGQRMISILLLIVTDLPHFH